MTRCLGGRHLTLLLSCLALLHHVHVADGAISICAAAASGANFALGGLPNGIIGENERDQNAEALIMLLMVAAVGGVVLVGVIYFAYKMIRRYVFKIQEPNKNFVVDKKVKCRSGEKYYYDEEAADSGEDRTNTPQY